MGLHVHLPTRMPDPVPSLSHTRHMQPRRPPSSTEKAPGNNPGSVRGQPGQGDFKMISYKIFKSSDSPDFPGRSSLSSLAMWSGLEPPSPLRALCYTSRRSQEPGCPDNAEHCAQEEGKSTSEGDWCLNQEEQSQRVT